MEGAVDEAVSVYDSDSAQEIGSVSAFVRVRRGT
jgi:hypothetical protein